LVGGNRAGRSDEIAFGKVTNAVANVVSGEEQLRGDQDVSTTADSGVRRHIQLVKIFLNFARMTWGL